MFGSFSAQRLNFFAVLRFYGAVLHPTTSTARSGSHRLEINVCVGSDFPNPDLLARTLFAPSFRVIWPQTVGI